MSQFTISLPLVNDLTPICGMLGGRSFISNDAKIYRMNELVRALEADRSQDKIAIKRKVVELDQRGHNHIKNRPIIIRILTAIRQFFGNLFYDRQTVLNNIQSSSSSFSTSTSKSIQEKLEGNLRFAEEQRKGQKIGTFSLQTVPIKDKIRTFIPRVGELFKPLEGKTLTVNAKKVGVASFEGIRPAMEDTDIATEITFVVNGKTYRSELYGVFDGHGGSFASSYVKNNIVRVLTECLQEQAELTDETVWSALKECFPKMSRHPGEGTTATVALILEGNIWVANVGDSRTVLNNNGRAVQLSEDAKPSMDRYRKKIVKLGGEVYYGRVGGQLAVARAIGDTELKGVCALPKITKFPLKDIQGRAHLILACDGLFDVASTNEVVKAVHNASRQSPEELAKRVVWSAFEKGSKDNITAIVVPLR